MSTPAHCPESWIVSFNVNSIKSFVTQDGLARLFETLHWPDIFCIQEHKLGAVGALTRPIGHVPGYTAWITHSQLPKLKGYSGVMTYVKDTSPWSVQSVEEGFSGLLQGATVLPEMPLNLKELESEGRCIITDHGGFVLFNVYFPAESTPDRAAFKMAFSRAVAARMQHFTKVEKRRVVLVGDVNVCAAAIDHCDPLQSLKDHNITKFTDTEPRTWFNAFLAEGWIDTFRFLHPTQEKAYSCWNTLTEARKGNFGTRIDYCIVSESMKDWIEEAAVWQHVHGSDHCPVAVKLRAPENVPLPHEAHHQRALTASICTKAMRHLDEQPKLTGFFGSAPLSAPKTVLTKERIASTSPKKMALPSAAKTVSAKSLPPAKKARTEKAQLNLTSFFVKPQPVAGPPKEEVKAISSPPVVVAIEDEEYSVPESVLQAIRDADAKEAQKVAIAPKEPAKPSAFDRLLKPLPPPLCAGHQEPCREFTVNKSGVNHGKKFYLCARPVGPSHEKNGEWRCDTFIWKNLLEKRHRPP